MQGYPFTVPYDVRVADVNYGGHVSNAAVLSFFQDARIACLADLGPFSELDIGEGSGLILPEAHVRYLAEMFLGDRLVIGVRVTEIRKSSFVFGYRIERGGEGVAEGTTSLVSFDYTARKTKRLPSQFREALVSFEKEVVD